MPGKLPVDRRRFLQLAGGTVAATAATALSSSVARAAAIAPAVNTGTIRDVEHIVILMQENTYPAGWYGLGPRVPMLVVSPWSRGGWVNSEVFDHTSLVRFIEQRFGVAEPHFSPVRVPNAPGTRWYDVKVTSGTDSSYLRAFAGHLETGQPDVSDPAFGRA